MMSPTFRIAVHLHLYYVEMWPELREQLRHLAPHPYHLCVTLTEPDEELAAGIRAFHPGADIRQVPNHGYDVGPFVHFLHSIDLADYDLILKIHTKNTRLSSVTWINKRCINRAWWLRLLLSSLLGSARRVQKNLEHFARDPHLGMLGSAYLMTGHPSHAEKVRPLLGGVMRRLGYEQWEFRFIAGTMFWVRSAVMESIKRAYSPADFEPTREAGSDGTLAHALERAFGCATLAAGYRLLGVGRSMRFELAALRTAVMHFLYRKKYTRNGSLIVKICKIPVYYKQKP